MVKRMPVESPFFVGPGSGFSTGGKHRAGRGVSVVALRRY
jgi:hypothetical protein